MMHHSMNVAGIDTGKAELHVHLLPSDERFVVQNTAEGVAALVARCRKAGIARAAIEATSIYHRAAARGLAEAGIETAVVQPRQSRAFAQAVLQWAKSDAIDARVLARLAQVIDTARPLAPRQFEAFSEALAFIENLEARIVWLKTSRERFADRRLLKAIDADIKRLERSRTAHLRALEASLRKDGGLAQRLDLLLSIPCIAERTALCLLIRMPELGSITREQAASLAGLAPALHDSGKSKGERHIYGGRARVRKTLYMAAFTGASRWNPELQACYRRLIANGKHHTEAVVACARKLLIFANTVLARKTLWIKREVMP
jgi:transposase